MIERLLSALGNFPQNATPQWVWEERQNPGIGIKRRANIPHFTQSEFKQSKESSLELIKCL